METLSPAAGRQTGGTTVVIRGAWFDDVEKVRFGSHAARFRVVNAHEIRATSPSGSGTVPVSVTTTVGTSAPTKSDRFMYEAHRSQNSKPQNSKPQNSKPQNSKPQNSKPQNSK